MAFSACSSDGDDQGSLKDSNANKNVVSASVPTEATGLEFPKIVANGTSRNVVLVRRTADYGVTYSTYYDTQRKIFFIITLERNWTEGLGKSY